jgi:hypothetical protein
VTPGLKGTQEDSIESQVQTEVGRIRRMLSEAAYPASFIDEARSKCRHLHDPSFVDDHSWPFVSLSRG